MAYLRYGACFVKHGVNGNGGDPDRIHTYENNVKDPMDWLSAGLTLLNKAIPERKEDAVNAVHQLEEMHGRALASMMLILAAQIRKRIKQIKETYEDM